MKTALGERDGNTVKFAVEVSREELEEAFNTRVKKLAREVRIPGFRDIWLGSCGSGSRVC